MDYEKEYKKRLDDARYWHDVSEGDIPAVLEEIFPELRESEDDRIRGAIIDHLKDYNLTEWAAWLEKQGEQKSAWSEDDSPYYDDICEILINLLHSETADVNKDAIQKDLDWLNSLKQDKLIV